MTSQSPRIYLYKITFEEVPYYYYGVHKEKKFDEKYWGSPKTNRWCWELYTPKKQILQFFDFTDDGWTQAQEIEKRLIKPFYNTDKWCLNESCGGIISLEILRKTGDELYKFGIGIHKRTKDQIIQDSKKAGKKTYDLGLGIHSLTSKEKSEVGRIGGKISGQKTYELGIGIHSRTKEQKVEDGMKGAEKCRELGVGLYSLTSEDRSKYGKKGGKISGKKTSSQRWMCSETGYVSTPGGLSSYQKKRGIDTSKRVRVS